MLKDECKAAKLAVHTLRFDHRKDTSLLSCKGCCWYYNGNQTTRTIGGVTYTFTYDYENHLTAVSGGSISASFVYDADGNRVKGTVNGTTTVYIAGLYEYQGGATTLYYEGNALRRTGYAANNGVFYLLQDQLKSSSVLANQNGTVNSRNYFYPFGGNRGGAAFSTLTTKRFTGQYHESGLPGGEGLSYYGARWYDAQLGRFISPDVIIPNPGNPQDLNRYAYTLNSPLRYTDPSGHASQPISFPDNPGWVQSIMCFFSGCTFANGRVYLTPDPILLMPVPMAFAEEAGTSIAGGLFRRATQFFKTGTPPAMQSALAQVLQEGDIVAIRDRPVMSRFFQGWFPPKTISASNAPLVEKIKLGWFDTSLRLTFDWERFRVYTSDLDIGYIIRNKKFLPEDEVLDIVENANNIYGRRIFTHGDMWNGLQKGAAGITPDHVNSLTHLFGVGNGSLNHWFSAGFQQTIDWLTNWGRLWLK